MTKQEYDSLWKKEHREARRAQAQRYRRRLKEQMVVAYGGRCACGETDINKLEFDHTTVKGNEQRNALFGHGHSSPGGWMFYLWLKKNRWPQGLGELKCIRCHDQKHGRTPGTERLKGSPAMDGGRNAD